MNLYKAGGLMAIIAVVALLVIPTIADAKFGRGFGSRGLRTFSRPPVTRTAPKAVRPIQRTQTPRQSINRSGNRAGSTTRPGLFGGMSKGGFMAGLLGAGALGLLFGYGLSGGLGGLASILGLVLQAGLIVMVVMLVMSWFRRRQPAMANARSGNARSGDWKAVPDIPSSGAARQAYGDERPSSGAAPYDGNSRLIKPLQVAEADFDAFERLLGEIQTAYAKEDLTALGRLATDEMCSYFAEDIEENKQKGQALRISGVKLLQGDLSEAWKEPDGEYASVAMRFSLADAIVDRTTGRTIEGSLTEPQELTEVWTFVRQPSGSANDWRLSAVQPEDDEDDED